MKSFIIAGKEECELYMADCLECKEEIVFGEQYIEVDTEGKKSMSCPFCGEKIDLDREASASDYRYQNDATIVDSKAFQDWINSPPRLPKDFWGENNTLQMAKPS